MLRYEQLWTNKAATLSDEQLAAEIASLERTLGDLPFRSKEQRMVHASASTTMFATACGILMAEQTRRMRERGEL